MPRAHHRHGRAPASAATPAALPSPVRATGQAPPRTSKRPGPATHPSRRLRARRPMTHDPAREPPPRRDEPEPRRARTKPAPPHTRLARLSPCAWNPRRPEVPEQVVPSSSNLHGHVPTAPPARLGPPPSNYALSGDWDAARRPDRGRRLRRICGEPPASGECAVRSLKPGAREPVTAVRRKCASSVQGRGRARGPAARSAPDGTLRGRSRGASR